MKRARTLLVGGAVVIVLVAGFVVLKNLPKKSTTAPNTSVQLSKIERDKLASIVLKHGDTTVDLRFADKKWIVEYPYKVAWDSASISNVVDAFTSLYAERTIQSDPTDLAQFGLSPAQGVATAELTDGSKVVYQIGNKTPEGGSYYFMKQGDPALYAVNSYTVHSLLATIDSLRDKTLPGVDTKSLTYVKILNGDRTIEIRPIPKDAPLAFVSFADMELTKPFPVPRPVDSEAFAKVFQSYPSYFQIQKFISDNPKNLAAYGLEPPAAQFVLKDAKGKSIDLLVGKSLPDGTVYAKLAEGPTVFTVNKTDISSVIDATPFQLEDKFLLIPNIENVDGFEIQTATATYTAKIVRTPEKDAKPDKDGKLPTVSTYFLNGKKLESGPFKDFYQDVIGLLADSANPHPYVPLRPVVTITFQLDKGARTYHEYLVPYPYEPFSHDFYAVYRDGLADVLLSKNQVNRMIDKAKELLSK